MYKERRSPKSSPLRDGPVNEHENTPSSFGDPGWVHVQLMMR